jgi:hypothetical protein
VICTLYIYCYSMLCQSFHIPHIFILVHVSLLHIAGLAQVIVIFLVMPFYYRTVTQVASSVSEACCGLSHLNLAPQLLHSLYPSLLLMLPQCHLYPSVFLHLVHGSTSVIVLVPSYECYLLLTWFAYIKLL